MIKRKIIIDDYDTAEHFWTLAGWSCPTPEPVTELVDVPGRIDGPLDASTALADDIRYASRPLEARLESSEGTRQERKVRIDELVARFHGQRVKLWGPDDEGRYLMARLSVVPEYNDLAHAAVVVTGTCEPWLYDNEETHVGVLLCGKNIFDNQNLVTIIRNYGEAQPIDTGVRCLVKNPITWTYDLLKVAPIEVLVGKTITLSYKATASGANTPRVCLGYCSADGDVRVQKAISLGYSDSLSLSVEPSALVDCKYVGLWLYSNHTGTSVEGDYIDFVNLQIEVGDTATDYEAYSAGTSSPQTVTLTNDRRPVCPLITVQGEVGVEYNGGSFALSDGAYKLPDVMLTPGENVVQVSGTGAAAFTYRKAVL